MVFQKKRSNVFKGPEAAKPNWLKTLRKGQSG